MKKKVFKFVFWSIGWMGIASFCFFYFIHTPSYTPKPYGFHYIPLPPPAYQTLPDTFPYSFEFSQYATWSADTSTIAEPYWINLSYPAFSATIQLTYKAVKRRKELLASYLADSYKLTTKHQIRAYEIEEQVMKTPSGIAAAFITIEGQVPTPYQFYTTDSTQHFLRGALYFNTALANDSLAPIIDFIKEDMRHMVYTLRWK
jgi:gliding motility-associated lipoprotein GldD